MNGKAFFVTGIDTNIGKSYATGILGRSYLHLGKSVITQKLIQTGCTGVSEDIVLHRSLMNIDVQDIDHMGITCPYLFAYPASPHLSSRMEKQEVHTELIDVITKSLQERYEVVLLEGAGGLMTPVTKNILTIDYVAMYDLPVVLVTSGRLGSINHTLLSLNACKNHHVPVDMVIYNDFDTEDKTLSQETYKFIYNYLHKHHSSTRLLRLPEIKNNTKFVFAL